MTHALSQPTEISNELAEQLARSEIVGAVVNECLSELEGLSPDQQFNVAAAVYVQIETGGWSQDVPWTFVFQNDDPTEVGSRLYHLLQTPDGSTPLSDPSLLPTVDAIEAIIDKHLENSDGIQFSRVGAYVVTRELAALAAGKPGQRFYVFADYGREQPGYADGLAEWPKMLSSLYGSETANSMLELNPEIIRILQATEDAADRYYARNNLRQPGEFDAALGGCATDMMKADDAPSFRAATRILDLGRSSYRAETYALRGLEPPDETPLG